VLNWFDSVSDATLWLSVLTLGEIKKGTELLDEGARRRHIEAWLDELRTSFADRIIPVDEAVALCWGVISGTTKKSGRTRSPIDSLLAATAICRQMRLVTRNVADFHGTGVEIVNPWEPGQV
jgi:predicted nucleic acid-binding protein